MTTLTPDAALDLFRQPPHRLLNVGNADVAYRRVGQGPDVVFVHGWPASGATFARMLPHLCEHVTCHLLDLPGAGDSRFDRASEIGIGPHIKAVQSVVDALGLEDFAAVGHDSGGLIARHAFAGDPRLRAMGLVDTEQPQGLHWRFRQFLWMAKIPKFEHILAWAANRPRLRRSPFLLGDCFHDRDLLGGTFEEFFLAPLRDQADRRWAAGEFAKHFDTALVHALGEAHAKIDVPVQLAWGEDDPFFPVSWACEMADTFPNARLHVVKNAKLFVHEERPEEVAEVLLPTLAGVPRVGASSRAAS